MIPKPINPIMKTSPLFTVSIIIYTFEQPIKHYDLVLPVYGTQFRKKEKQPGQVVLTPLFKS
jgi:hypothetical protein